MVNAMTIDDLLPVFVALASGGFVAAMARWRPEATTAAVAASEQVIETLRQEVERMREEINKLRDEISDLRAARISAEREAERWHTQWIIEHERRVAAEAQVRVLTKESRHEDGKEK